MLNDKEVLCSELKSAHVHGSREHIEVDRATVQLVVVLHELIHSDPLPAHLCVYIL